MPRRFGSPEHWRQRAKEARALAEKLSDAEAKKAMLRVAEGYELVAERAEVQLPRSENDPRPA